LSLFYLSLISVVPTASRAVYTGPRDSRCAQASLPGTGRPIMHSRQRAPRP